MKAVLPSADHLWPFGFVVRDDARQRAQCRASNANCLNVLVFVCPAQRGVDTLQPITGMSESMSKWKQTLTWVHVPSFCLMSAAVRAASDGFKMLFLCVAMQTQDYRLCKDHGGCRSCRLWPCALMLHISGYIVLSAPCSVCWIDDFCQIQIASGMSLESQLSINPQFQTFFDLLQTSCGNWNVIQIKTSCCTKL